MTSRLTRPQHQRLTELVSLLRADWDLPGIRAAVDALPPGTSAIDAAVVTIRAAANRDARTPGLIPLPGSHWQGTAAGASLAPVTCPEHPARTSWSCPECAATLHPPTPGTLAAIRATVAHRERPRRDHKPPPPADITAARARLDAEQEQPA